MAHHIDLGIDREGRYRRVTGSPFKFGSRPWVVAQDRRPSQTYRLERVAGRRIIGARRSNSAHLHRSWRATSEYASELRAQFKKAAARRATSVVVTSGELYQLLGGYPGSTHGMPACCDAMRAEMKPGDILLVESNGVGLTVCYQLTRPQ